MSERQTDNSDHIARTWWTLKDTRTLHGLTELGLGFRLTPPTHRARKGKLDDTRRNSCPEERKKSSREEGVFAATKGRIWRTIEKWKIKSKKKP